ncbi:hypothetical protein WA026_016459 [Henosepilachna vigintioctopunctata]|uniref:TIL domain-containing protein n=1 Tax=Henosepilachna vigintioctopunctata TaxID=420089 RepID=A0AAW1UFX3_9CUCU
MLSTDSNQDRICGPYGRYDTCGSACAPTCQMKNPANICTLQCVPKCICSSGSILQSASGKCIRSQDCP